MGVSVFSVDFIANVTPLGGFLPNQLLLYTILMLNKIMHKEIERMLEKYTLCTQVYMQWQVNKNVSNQL